MSGWDAAMAMQIQSAFATRYLYGDGPFLGRDEARAALADYEMRAITTAKAALNWSGDEPPTTELPGGGQGTPVPVSPFQKELARWRKSLHER
jgi:hypothetical protein